MNATRTGSRTGTIARHAALVMLAAALMPAADLAAQACRGVPLADGSLAVSGFAGFTEEADSRWGGEAAYGLTGPVTVVAGYTRTGYEGAAPDVATNLHVRGGATIERGRVFLAASHTWVRARQGNRSTALGIGVRLGGRP